MWNNLDYASEKLNNCEHFRIHKEHLERLIQAKPAIENSPPLKPFFIYDKASKREERRQELEKINYQNKILIERIDSIGRKPSPYSNCMLKPSIFPALNKSKSTYNDKKNNLILLNQTNFYSSVFKRLNLIIQLKALLKAIMKSMKMALPIISTETISIPLRSPMTTDTIPRNSLSTVPDCWLPTALKLISLIP